MKSYQIILLSIIMLLIGVFTGPYLTKLVGGNSKDKVLTKNEKQILNKESKEAFYDWFLNHFGNKVGAAKRLNKLIESGRNNKMGSYTLVKLVQLLEVQTEMHSLDEAEHTYEFVVKLTEQFPEILKQKSIKDIACLAYAHSLAGKNAILNGKYDLAENRFARARVLIKGVKDLNILRPFILEEEAWLAITQDNREVAFEKFEKVAAWQKRIGIEPIKRMNSYVNLCYLAHKTDKTEKMVGYIMEAKRLLPPKRDPKEKREDVYNLFLKAATKLADNRDDAVSEQILNQFWRMIVVNNTR